MKNFIAYLSNKIGTQIQKWTSLSGGDISSVYLLETSKQSFILKTNTQHNALAMFQSEKIGLTAIADTKTINTPQILLCEQYQTTSFLLMKYIPSKRPDKKDFARLGQALGTLHQTTNATFGWHESNFIGSLKQFNKPHENWLDFYIKERLQPQFQLAQQNSLLSKKETPSKKVLISKGTNLFKNIQPALLHGDLWSGNFLINTAGIPFLIDPATHFGHSEVDLAMTRLFSGFDSSFYDAYHEIHPQKDGMEKREQWYQLYYLLVHLNLFGRSYYGAVIRILKDL